MESDRDKKALRYKRREARMREEQSKSQKIKNRRESRLKAQKLLFAQKREAALKERRTDQSNQINKALSAPVGNTSVNNEAVASPEPQRG